MNYKKLPADWGIDALAAEAKRRGTDYGKLVANTTLYERDQIREQYRKEYGKRKTKKRSKPRHTEKEME